MTYLTWRWFCCLPFEGNIIVLCILAISTLILPSLCTPNTRRTTQALFLSARGTKCWGNCLQFLVLTQSLSFNVWLTVDLPIWPPILQDLAFPSHTPSSPVHFLPPSLLTTDRHRHLFTICWFLFWQKSVGLGLRFVSYMCNHFSMAASDDAVASARPLVQALHLLDSQHVSWNGWIFQCSLCLIFLFSFGVLFGLW